MEGSAGNPSAASSRPLPAHPDHELLQPADRTLTTLEDTGQKPESVSPSGSPTYQTPEQTLQRPKKTRHRPKETLQRPEEIHLKPEKTYHRPKVTHRCPEENQKKSKETLKKPEETHHSPEGTLQSPEETQHKSNKTIKKPEQTHQKPKETLQSPEESHQSPEETQQKSEETIKKPEETHQRPKGTLQSPEVTPKSPEETHQRPKGTLQSPEVTPKSPEETHQRPKGTLQSPEVTPKSPEETHQRPKEALKKPKGTLKKPEETHQRPKETFKKPKGTLKKPEETHQRPKGTLQSPEVTPKSPEETHQRPKETLKKPEETHQKPKEILQSPEVTLKSPEETLKSCEETQQKSKDTLKKPEETLKKPEDTHQIPKVTHQSPEESFQSLEEILQSPEETQQRPKVTHQSPEETHQRPKETHQRRGETLPSPALNPQRPKDTYQSLEETLQNLGETQESGEDPFQLYFIKSLSGKDPTLKPELFKTKPDKIQLQQDLLPGEPPPPPDLNTEQTPPPPLHDLNSEQTPPPPLPDLSIEQTPPPPPPPDLNTEQTPPPPPPDLSTEQTPPPPPPDLNTEQTPPPPPPPPPPDLNTEQTPPPPPPPHLNTEQRPPPPHLNTEQTPAPPHLNTEQTPPPPHLNTEQTPPPPPPPPPHLNTEQTPPPPHLNTEQTPPPQLNTEQTPPLHLNTEQTPPLPHLSIEQTPPPPPLHLNTEQTPPSPPLHLNTEQTPPLHLNTEPPPPPPHLNTEQTPPPLHLNTEQTPPPLDLNSEQTPPPPPHLNTEQTPPPSSDHQNQLPPPIIVLTNVSTLAPPAPPLINELFSDQVQPPPPASPAGEPKLCGFLQKQGGPLRAWKERWFTYEEKKNQLFYYRTPQDVRPLGRVELCSATFTYPLNAERGTFHIKTPERTFVLKAVSQEVMLYWLQQLQGKRWQHRQTSTCPDLTNNNYNQTTDDFLPPMKSPVGLVGEGAANTPSQRPALTNMSIKHPLIAIQNSVHSLRKRSSQEWSQSVFHVETPSMDPTVPDSPVSPSPRTPSEPQTPPPCAQVAPVMRKESPSRLDSRSRWSKTRSSMMVLRRDTMSSERTSRLLQEKQMLTEEVKAQKELVWILHKALEASQLEKRTCTEFLAATGEQERLELLRHRERQATDLRARLQEAREEAETAREEAETARRSQDQSDAKVTHLEERVRILEEKNTARQEVIIKLSDQLTACMAAPPRSSGGDVDSQTFRRLQQQIENLQDDMEAYQTQNRFLNSEIQQLTRLWRTSSEQEKSLMVKCAQLEAGNCQAESRYLSVLRQLQEVKALDPVQRAAVQKMIEDAVKGDLKSTKLNLTREHDEYGFKIIPDYEVEDMKLLAKIQALEIRSHNLLQQEQGERPLLARWAQYLAGRCDDDLVPSPELKGLLRAGVPPEYRQQVWRWLVRARTRTIREQHPQRYQQLCEKSRASSQPAYRQIQLDLHRTLTTNQHFTSPSSPALQQLRRVLLAFSWQNPAVGYCQGLNRLAALSLLVLQSEEDAFWCLVAVVDAIMPQDYYTKDLVASQADQRVLKDLLSEKLPRLAAHFEDHQIDVTLVTFNWFLVVFVESLPSDLLLPLWDAFLYEGTKVIFRYALALFKYKEDDIMKIRDSVEIYQYLRFFTKTITDCRKLINIAFSDMNPFPGRMLRTRRAFHLERLQGELRELEEQQRAFVTESAERKDKELDTAVSEDDDEL
ncbi:TBC1 domain family member 2A [Notolabrus celidotus]|uniref:TBC1 domain family member 2A n=1 Tax=Notolabrus celidotus TaxID=1203425 RepID=UPI0014904656|nr:TBC1 domain family member 2A [Notolabrus celidotus]